MRQIVTGMFAVALIVLAGATSASAQGRSEGRGGGRGVDNRPFETPPGHARKQEQQIVQVPEPATLTLLGLAIGGGVLARGLTSRRNSRTRR